MSKRFLIIFGATLVGAFLADVVVFPLVAQSGLLGGSTPPPPPPGPGEE